VTQVYVHIGQDIPSHSVLTINHNLKYSTPSYFLTDSLNIPLSLDTSVKVINLKEFNSDKSKALKSFNYFEGFWLYTFERLFVLEEFMKSGPTDCLHIENDVVIYDSPDISKYRELYPNKVVINPIGERYCTFAYSYININALMILNQELLDFLSLGREEINNRLSGEMLNEMTCLSYLFNQGKNYLDFFPILPEGQFSKNYSELRYLYDSASYGQFLDGTPGTIGIPYRGQHHYIGRFLIDSDKIIFKNNKPILIKNDKEYSLFNLHIHSKRIGNFIY